SCPRVDTKLLAWRHIQVKAIEHRHSAVNQADTFAGNTHPLSQMFGKSHGRFDRDIILLLPKDRIQVCEGREEIVYISHVFYEGVEIDDKRADDRLNSDQLPERQLPRCHEPG